MGRAPVQVLINTPTYASLEYQVVDVMHTYIVHRNATLSVSVAIHRSPVTLRPAQQPLPRWIQLTLFRNFPAPGFDRRFWRQRIGQPVHCGCGRAHDTYTRSGLTVVFDCASLP